MIRNRNGSYAWAIFAVLVATSSVEAGSPWYVPWEGPWPWSRFEGSRRIDVIGPIGNRLPPSYRRQYNRPTYIGGKIAAKIAPSSQEAMAFHRAEELGLYDNNGVKGALAGKHCPPQRVEQHYFYPKPWEALAIGPRRDRMTPPEDHGEPRSLRELGSNDEFEPPEFRDLLQQSDALDDTLELVTPVGEPEPSIMEQVPPADSLAPPADFLAPPERAFEPPQNEIQ